MSGQVRRYSCDEPLCGCSFLSFASLEKHSRVHAVSSTHLEQLTECNAASRVTVADNLQESVGSGSSSSVVPLPSIEGPDSLRNVHEMLTRWELDDRVPQTVKQRQKEAIEEVYAAKFRKLKVAAQECINRHVPNNPPQVDFDTDPSFEGLSSFFPEVLETIRLEKSYTKEQLGVVEPIIVHLGDTTVELPGLDDTFEQVVTRDECAIFPFAQQVRSVMSNGDLYDAMQAFRQCNVNGSTDGKIRSFYDGDAWKTRPFFELHRDAYVLSFYYDDVTMTNPIGQYKCKVGFFYYSFLDLGPAYSGKDATIFAAYMHATS